MTLKRLRLFSRTWTLQIHQSNKRAKRNNYIFSSTSPGSQEMYIELKSWKALNKTKKIIWSRSKQFHATFLHTHRALAELFFSKFSLQRAHTLSDEYFCCDVSMTSRSSQASAKQQPKISLRRRQSNLFDL